ncbi:MAG: GAF domain-containing protein [Verrucomicrobia bacterium]|nr:GAF domain-containing protein [Cytophagales bacterium]
MIKFNAITRLTLLSSVVVLIFFGFGSYVIYSIYQIEKHHQLNYEIDKVLNHANQCQLSQKEFLLGAYTDENFVMKGSNASYEEFNTSINQIIKQTNAFSENPIVKNLDRKILFSNLKQDLESYQKLFVQTAALMKEKGFKDLGLEGKMREAIHYIENSELLPSKVNLLTLRRHEKDFLLRKDPQYIEKFRSDFNKFAVQIENIEANEEEKLALSQALTTYQANFEKITEIEKQIGFSEKEGLRSKMAFRYSSIDAQLNDLIQQINLTTRRKTREIIFTIISLFVVVMLAFVAALRFLLLAIAKPIAELRDAANKISYGDLSVNVEHIKASKLLVRLIESVQRIVFKLQEVMRLIEQISTRKVTQEQTMSGENDDISKTLNKIIFELQVIDKEEEKRRWYNESVAKFGDVLRLNQLKTQDVYDNIIKNYVKILDATQGALFVLEEAEESFLTMKACYAYERKKFINKKIYAGEGLAGTAWLEKDTILLTDIPDDYVEITSGLGNANPTCLLIVPLKINEQVVGVVEIASFSTFEEHEIKLVETLAENVASFIQNNKVNEKTRRLLETSEMLTQQMCEQEEELRQNMEEMQATQEEMRRNETEMEQQIHKLKNENNLLKSLSVN